MKKINKAKENKILNTMRLEFASISENESFARGTVAAFASQVNPTLDEINDVKTAISEAVTNCVVHAYAKNKKATNKIVVECDLYADALTVSITDFGMGIPNIEKAMQPFYTTKPDEERSGMGFTVMQSFMDTLKVVNNQGGGTTITMQKFFDSLSNTNDKRASGDV